MCQTIGLKTGTCTSIHKKKYQLEEEGFVGIHYCKDDQHTTKKVRRYYLTTKESVLSIDWYLNPWNDIPIIIYVKRVSHHLIPLNKTKKKLTYKVRSWARFPMDEGIVPVSWLELKVLKNDMFKFNRKKRVRIVLILVRGEIRKESTYNVWSPTRLPIDEGIIPLSWLYCKLLKRRPEQKTKLRRFRFSQFGCVVSQWETIKTYKVKSLTRLPIDEGMMPVNWLLLRSLKKTNDMLENSIINE